MRAIIIIAMVICAFLSARVLYAENTLSTTVENNNYLAAGSGGNGQVKSGAMALGYARSKGRSVTYPFIHGIALYVE